MMKGNSALKPWFIGSIFGSHNYMYGEFVNESVLKDKRETESVLSRACDLKFRGNPATY